MLTGRLLGWPQQTTCCVAGDILKTGRLRRNGRVPALATGAPQVRHRNMKEENPMKILFLPLAAALSWCAMTATAADVGVSVSVSQPGLYGRIDIGNVPAPEIIFPTPVVVVPAPVGVVHQPVYLHVPPGHEKKWKKYCRRYDACGVPVYFVKERWYNTVYVPARHGRGGHGGKHHDDHDHGHGHDKGGGHGKGGGKGHGKGNH